MRRLPKLSVIMPIFSAMRSRTDSKPSKPVESTEKDLSSKALSAPAAISAIERSTVAFSSSMPSVSPAIRYSPICAKTFDGECIPNTLFTPSIMPLNFLSTHCLNALHALFMPFFTPATRAEPTSRNFLAALPTMPKAELTAFFTGVKMLFCTHERTFFSLSFMPFSSPSEIYRPCSAITVDGDSMPKSFLNHFMNGSNKCSFIHLPKSDFDKMPLKKPSIASTPALNISSSMPKSDSASFLPIGTAIFLKFQNAKSDHVSMKPRITSLAESSPSSPAHSVSLSAIMVLRDPHTPFNAPPISNPTLSAVFRVRFSQSTASINSAMLTPMLSQSKVSKKPIMVSSRPPMPSDKVAPISLQFTPCTEPFRNFAISAPICLKSMPLILSCTVLTA